MNDENIGVYIHTKGKRTFGVDLETGNQLDFGNALRHDKEKRGMGGFRDGFFNITQE